MTFLISPEWEQQKRPGRCSADEAFDLASTCTLRIVARHPNPNGPQPRPLTRLVDHRQVPADGPRVSAYRFAEWLVWHWWRLRWEPSPSKPNGNLSWRQAHETSSIGGGWLWPHITFNGDGEFMTVDSQSSEATESEPVSYVGDQECQVRASVFERGLDGFVNAVLGRLEAEGFRRSPLTDMWRELSDERNDESATKYRRIEALLGCNPDEAPADVVNEHLEAAKIIGNRAADEIAAEPALRDNPTSWLVPRTWRAWPYPMMVRHDSATAMDATVAAQLDSLVSDAATQPWHHLGGRLAHTLRDTERLGEGAITDTNLADVTGIRRSLLQGPKESDWQSPISFIWARHVSFRTPSRIERRFDTARLLGDMLCWTGDEPLRLATSTQTFRQKVQRAFAEELLCPTESLVDMVGTNPSEPQRHQAADEFAVPPGLVDTQLEQARRIQRLWHDDEDQALHNP